MLASPQGRQVAAMMRYTAAGGPKTVRGFLDEFVLHAHADELMVVHSGPTRVARLDSLRLLAEAWGLPGRS